MCAYVCTCTLTCVSRVLLVIFYVKLFRVLLDVEGDYSVLCERVLFQPFHIQLAAERNLCSAWYSKRPTLHLNCQMGEFKVTYSYKDSAFHKLASHY